MFRFLFQLHLLELTKITDMVAEVVFPGINSVIRTLVVFLNLAFAEDVVLFKCQWGSGRQLVERLGDRTSCR